MRYRFEEKYTTEPHPERPDLLSQCVVAVEEIQKTEREKSQGAPERFQFSHLTKYTERPAKVNKLGQVLSAVRHYDRFRNQANGRDRRAKKAPLRGSDSVVPTSGRPEASILESDERSPTP